MTFLNPLSASATRTASSAQPSSTPRGAAADAQATLANRLAERLGLAAGALGGKADDFTPEKVAGRVLGFIEQRLQSEAAAGADPARLERLLGQAREGVEKGFAEARKILEGMGALSGKVAGDIDDTYQRIQSGLGELDGRFGRPAPDRDALAVGAYSERFIAQAETFDLAVTTRDGDRLRISIAQASANWSQVGIAAAGGAGGTSQAISAQSGSLQIAGWQVSVEGELDTEEIEALEKLFSQVRELSDQFYAGDLAGAFDRAMALDMDAEQLASMSLRLTQSSVRQATDAYGAVAGPGVSAVNGDLQNYAQGLLDALRSADRLSQDPAGVLQELLKGGFSLDERFDVPRLERAQHLNGSLLEGLQSLLARASEGAAVQG